MKKKKSNVEIDEVAMFQSQEFRDAFRAQVEKDTWGNNLPMVYADEDGNIVKHWEDGKIEIIGHIKDGEEYEKEE